MWNKFMSLKKIFIVTGIVVALAFLAIVFFISPQKEKIVLQEQNENQENAMPAALPSETESSGNLENVEKARKIFENISRETVSDKTKKEGSKRIDFKNQKGSPIPLSDFEKALGVEVYPKLREYLSNGYQVFYCPGMGEKKELGVFLQYNMEKIYVGFTYEVLEMMTGWENTILPNLHTVLFPGIDFSEDNLNQKIEFRDGKYRYAEIYLPGGDKGSINYDAIEYGIIVAVSPSCLDKVHPYYESVESN